MQPRFNFSQFYENEQLSDVLLLVRIDGDVKQRIPGHGIVLANGAVGRALDMWIYSSTHLAPARKQVLYSLVDLHSCCMVAANLILGLCPAFQGACTPVVVCCFGC